MPITRALIRPSVILGVFIYVLMLTAPAAMAAAPSDIIIMRQDYRVTNLVSLFTEEHFAVVDDYGYLDDRIDIAHKIIQLSSNNGFDSGLITAICRYEDERTVAATRLTYFQFEVCRLPDSTRLGRHRPHGTGVLRDLQQDL
jgi:hypothetical protein